MFLQISALGLLCVLFLAGLGALFVLNSEWTRAKINSVQQHHSLLARNQLLVGVLEHAHFLQLKLDLGVQY